MTILSKAAGGLSLFSCIKDMHKTAVLYSNHAYADTAGDSYIRSSLASQKADGISYREAQRKNFFARNNVLVDIKATCARVGGYFSGLAKASIKYIPNLILGGLALVSKNKRLANISTVGLAGLEAYDLFKNATGINQRTDYLK